MAAAIGQVYSDYERVFSQDNPAISELVEPVGKSSAALMEKLGDVLNGMDAVTDDDDWTHLIFKEAQRLWPSP